MQNKKKRFTLKDIIAFIIAMFTSTLLPFIIFILIIIILWFLIRILI